MSRSRSVEIYLKPGIEEDDQVHEIWMACRSRGRPQDVFRRAIRLGLRAMAEGGELPRAALEAMDPELLGAPGPARALLARGIKARVRAAADEPRRAADELRAADVPAPAPMARPAVPGAAPVPLPPGEGATVPAAAPPGAQRPMPAAIPADPEAPPKPKLGRIM